MKILRITLFFLFAGVLLLVLSDTQKNEYVPRTQEEFQRETALGISTVLSIQGQEYTLNVPEGSTAYDVMKLASETSGLSFRGKDFGGIGFFVEEINGVSQHHPMYWIYSINGKKSQVGVSQYRLQPGDVISWSYEKSY